MHLESLVLKLFEIGSIRFGSFELKSGAISPFYIDVRPAVSVPALLIEIADAFYEHAKHLRFDKICGVPYTALPFATALSVRHLVPMILRRKEVKEYGTKRLLEGLFQAGERCLILEDVVTSGSSVLETAQLLKKEGLRATHALVLIDREQGGMQALRREGIEAQALLTVSSLLELLVRKGLLESSRASEVKKFIAENRIC